MSKDPLSKLSPATRDVIAAALLHERANKGKLMTVAEVTRLSEKSGASLGACLTFILGLGMQDGKLVRLGSPEHECIEAPDEDTEVALAWSEKHGDPGPS